MPGVFFCHSGGGATKSISLPIPKFPGIGGGGRRLSA